jgi:hypothetical protein
VVNESGLGKLGGETSQQVLPLDYLCWRLLGWI